MFLELAHTKMDVFRVTKSLVLSVYKETKAFPADERFSLTSQIRRAALSAHLNVAEGSSRKSTGERKRFYEIARGSVIEIDTGMDIAIELNYHNKENLAELGSYIIRSFQLLSKLIAE